LVCLVTHFLHLCVILVIDLIQHIWRWTADRAGLEGLPLAVGPAALGVAAWAGYRFAAA
jgi:hypothetical protein